MAGALDWFLFGFGALIAVFASIVAFGLLAFWLWMLVDCLKRPDRKFKYGGVNAKLIWVIVIVFLAVLGASVYYFLINREG